MVNKYDIIAATDLRLTGGTSSAVCAEARAFQADNLSVALLHLSTNFFPASQPFHPDILRLAQSLPKFKAGDGERLRCRALVLHNPMVLQAADLSKIEVVADRVIIVAHHLPLLGRSWLNYDPWEIDARVRETFETEVYWAPISPVCRESFLRLGFDLPVIATDWHNILATRALNAARSKPRHQRITIGRHSRADPQKWPPTKDGILQIYPDTSDIDVRVLGAGPFLKEVLDEIPRNWTLYSFNEISVGAFLESIDYFVYFHALEWKETFGRAAAEAALAGCVVILPKYLQETFGPAALYCEPGEVVRLVRELHDMPAKFASLSERGRKTVSEKFAPQTIRGRYASAFGKVEVDEEMRKHAATFAGAASRYKARARRLLTRVNASLQNR